MKVADMKMADIDKAIADRAKVRIIKAGGRESLLGVVGILMGYNRQYHTFKVGFIDSDGKYTGEKTVVGYSSIELVDDAPACICPRMEPPAKYGHHVVCPLRANDTDSEESDNVTIKEGPLTERQVFIINRLRAGKRHEEIAKAWATVPGGGEEPRTITVSVVKQECQIITAKFGTATVTQAVSLWATAQAYRETATLLGSHRPSHVGNETDVHVDHVLYGLMQILRERADRLTPR